MTSIINESRSRTYLKQQASPQMSPKKEMIKKEQKVQAHNLYLHTLSRGGYDRLRLKIMQDKMKVLEEAS